MSERKTYSRRREANLKRLIHQEITALQIYVLRGPILHLSEQAQEQKIYDFLHDLPEKVAAEYRRSLAATNTDKE